MISLGGVNTVGPDGMQQPAGRAPRRERGALLEDTCDRIVKEVRATDGTVESTA
jgi:hypothetical protein